VILDRATKLCDAETGILFRYENGAYHAQATRIPNAEFAAMFKEPRRPGPGSKSGLGRLMREKRTVHIPDLLQDAASAEGDPMRLQTLRGGVRTWLGVPLLKEGELIGAILVYRSEPRAFGEQQISLLETFADQAVIAIENVRLFNETKEALEQQTASAEILKVISGSPTDVQPVFEAIVQCGVRLFEGAAVSVVRPEGGEVRLMAIAEADRERAAKWASRFPNPLNRDYMHGAAILDCAMVDVPDALQAQDRFVEGRRNFALTGYRAVTVAPMVRDKFAIGAISVVRIAPGPLSEKQKALLRTFADQAVIAIENVRLFKELQARTEALTRSVGQLTALGEVGQAISSTLDLETVLKTIVSRAVQLTGLDGGSIYEYDDRAEEFRLQAAENMPQDVAEDIRKAPTRKGDGALGRTAITLEPTQVPDTLDDSYRSARKELLIRAGYRALLAVPLLREDHLLGGLLVNRKTPGAFAPEIVELLKTFATQSALAIQNARLFREIEEKGGQLETASRHKSEFLANMSHELRTPLNAIIGFSEVLSERMFGEINDKQAEYLGDILESGRHLLSLINDILDLSKIEAGRMELDPTDFDLPTAIENTLILVRERAHRRGIALEHKVDKRLGMIRADERKLKQVLLNLLSNALKFTPEGGQIDVRARVENGEAEISVADTGEGIAPEDQEAVFEEFRQVGKAAKKVEGTGLGLAISRKFIELHGGRIWVKSQLGIGSTFAFTLPLTIDSH
ncbi:MAG: GAF domain-containing protein, partial [Betaproteobacteria bacterium]